MLTINKIFPQELLNPLRERIIQDGVIVDIGKINPSATPIAAIPNIVDKIPFKIFYFIFVFNFYYINKNIKFCFKNSYSFN